jgi:nucleoside-diphosphate-sugar epimerase
MSETSNFFAGKTLFITGATGYLGKVLLERILWQLPEVCRVVLLMRPHCASDPEAAVSLRAERAIFGSSIFNRLRFRHGERFDAFVRDKVQAVAGDLSSPDLGLAPNSLEMLGSQVDFIINLAAEVNFHERLDNAVQSNTQGPYHLLKFATRFRNPILLHVSTAYVSGRRTGPIPEQALQPDVSAFDLMGIATSEPVHTENEIAIAQRQGESVERESQTRAARNEFRQSVIAQFRSARITGADPLDDAAERNRRRWVRDRLSEEGLSRARRFGWIDTYSFTKALGEQLLVKSANGIPIIILRPSIVESTLSQPEPGWIEGFRMSSPVLFGYGQGVLLDFPARRDAIIDFIPADFVVSALLACLTAAPCGGNPKVFHVASGWENPILLHQLMDYTREYFRHLPLRGDSGPIVPGAWNYPSSGAFDGWVRRRRLMLHMAHAVCEHLDFLPFVAQRKDELAVQQTNLKRLESVARLYAGYCGLDCQFQTDNTRELFRSLPSQDQREFFFDPTAIDWPTYFREIQLPGVRRHVLEKTSLKSFKFCAHRAVRFVPRSPADAAEERWI